MFWSWPEMWDKMFSLSHSWGHPNPAPLGLKETNSTVWTNSCLTLPLVNYVVIAGAKENNQQRYHHFTNTGYLLDLYLKSQINRVWVLLFLCCTAHPLQRYSIRGHSRKWKEGFLFYVGVIYTVDFKCKQKVWSHADQAYRQMCLYDKMLCWKCLWNQEIQQRAVSSPNLEQKWSMTTLCLL